MPLHARITLRSDLQGDRLALDLTEEKLRSRILDPYFEGRPFVVAGETIDPFTIQQIRINETDESSSHLLPVIADERARSRVLNIAVSDEWYVTKKGRDRTDAFIDRQVGADATPAPTAAGDLAHVVRTCERLPAVARQLGRRHGGRSTLEIGDEYDVQDLLHALLLLEFDDVRDESSNPTYLGKGSRIDLLLPAPGIAIEVKMTRASLDVKQLGSELAEDITRYADPDANRGATTLVIHIHDPGHRIPNHTSFAKDLSRATDRLQIVPVITT
jgi:REase_DpnII-MboI